MMVVSEEQKVIRVIDTGVVPVPSGNGEYDTSTIPSREVPGPISVQQPVHGRLVHVERRRQLRYAHLGAVLPHAEKNANRFLQGFARARRSLRLTGSVLRNQSA